LITYLGIARFYSKADLGSVGAILALAYIIDTLFSLGFPLYIQRESAWNSKDLHRKVTSLFYFKIFVLPFYFITIYAYNILSGQDNFLLTFVVSAYIYFFGVSTFFNNLFYGKNKFKTVFRIHLISRLLIIVIFTFFLIISAKIEILLTSFIIGSLYQIFNLLSYYKSSEFNLDFTLYSIDTLKGVLSKSFFFGAGLIFVALYDKLDVLIIQNLLKIEAVAIYIAAYSIYKLPQLFSNVLLTVSYTTFSNEFKEKGKLNHHSVKIVFYFILAVILFSVIPIYNFAEEIVLLSYGDNYLQSAELLVLLSIGIAGLLLNNLTGTILNSTGNEKLPTLSVFIGLLINIFLCILLISIYGLIGAVISTIATEFIVFLIQIYFIYSKRIIS
jgi:O-antigen/teichoic acid export membrane protein